jgi:glycosyltransferase involved in cell wall biosynthesis
VKILFTSHRFYPDIGGIEVNSEILASYFSSQGHKVRLVTQSVAEGERTFPFEIIRKPSARQLIALHRWADVVYQNNIELGALWPGLFIRKPTVISVHTWIRANDGRVRPVDRLKKWILTRADAVIAISEAIRRDSFEGAIVIGNPYRSSLFRVIPGIRRENSVAFLGRFVSDKGADLLIRAFGEVKGMSSGLTLIGSGPEEQTLRRLGQQVGVHARFTGPLQGEELVRELNRHEILAVPSRWPEPFGNVALEGMACGCIVVGSSGGGLPDAIGDGGVIYAGGDGHALVMALRSCLADLILRERCLKRAARHLSNHTEETVSAKYLNLIASVTNNIAARESGS